MEQRGGWDPHMVPREKNEELRSNKSLTWTVFDIWYSTFDIWHLNIWTFEHLNIWTFKHLNIWTLEHQLHWHCFSDLGKYSKNYFFSSCLLIQRGEGGLVSAGKKDTGVFFKRFFLQKSHRIILGPPKHVLHLVCSVLGISTAIKTALKVAL